MTQLYRPCALVEYCRFVRLLPDGSAYTLLSPDPPSSVSHCLSLYVYMLCMHACIYFAYPLGNYGYKYYYFFLLFFHFLHISTLSTAKVVNRLTDLPSAERAGALVGTWCVDDDMVKSDGVVCVCVRVCVWLCVFNSG